jgi:predicted nucleic acid-binding protein
MIYIFGCRTACRCFPATRRPRSIHTLGGETHPVAPVPALYLCDAVLTEAAHFLGSARKLIDAVERGLLVSRFDTHAAAPRLRQLISKYADRQMDFADACLVYMSEQTKDCRVVTIDRADFSVYRRHGREPIPVLFPN